MFLDPKWKHNTSLGGKAVFDNESRIFQAKEKEDQPPPR